MSGQFPNLLRPIQIGPIEVRNRLFNPGHGKSMAVNGMPEDQHYHYWVERARGGVGLIVTEVESVHPTSREPYVAGMTLRNWDESVVARYQKIAKGVHEHGARIFAQLWHSGLAAERAVKSPLPLLAPSAIPLHIGSEIPKEMELEDIREIIRSFGDAADRVRRGGYDGVEIHAAYEWLIHSFLSPRYNRRTDKYGGSLTNRMRFLREVIDEIRGRVGDSIAVGLRVNGDEFISDEPDRRAAAVRATLESLSGATEAQALELPELQEICQLLEQDGKIDFINTTVGGPDTLHMTVAPMAIPPGYQLHVPRALKEVLKRIPVMAVGRLTTPVEAEAILAGGSADMVGMVRELIADPEFVNKIRDERLDDIRPCVGANSCIARVLGDFISCIQNPATGREEDWGSQSLKAAENPRNILVVGGGPAGLEAARIAALRGHHVTLIEKQAQLGGQVLLAAEAPHRASLRGITDYLAHQLEKLHVEVILNQEATADWIRKETPDIVVIATGSQPCTGIAGAVSAHDVLTRTVELGDSVLVVDGTGHHEAAGTIEYIAATGRHVEVVTRERAVGMLTSGTLDAPLLWKRLSRLGVKVHASTWPEQIFDRSVVVRDLHSGELKTLADIDDIVEINQKQANASLYLELKEMSVEVRRIGDALAPRLIDHAIYDGHALGRQV